MHSRSLPPGLGSIAALATAALALDMPRDPPPLEVYRIATEAAPRIRRGSGTKNRWGGRTPSTREDLRAKAKAGRKARLRNKKKGKA